MPALLRTMPHYRRYYIENALVFHTIVTHHRRPVFLDPAVRDLFFTTLRAVQALHPFRLYAYVLLPDHLHWIMHIPPGAENFSKVVQSIKWNFVRNVKQQFPHIDLPLWQKRFWDHLIRDEADLARHFDYIHWNPVKHGCADSPARWPASSFLHWVKQGMYPPEWGSTAEPRVLHSMEAE